MDLLFWRKDKNQDNKIDEEVKYSKKLKSFVVKTVGLISRDIYSRDNFEGPAYDFEEIKVASVKDSYIRESLLRHNYLIYKAGYNLKGGDDIVNYLNQRLRIMNYATGTPVDIVLQQAGDDLVKYSNAFLVKARVKPEDIPGKLKINPIYNDKAVAGYFRIDPCQMRIKRDSNGAIKKYQQVSNGVTKDFKPEDVVHMYINKEAGEAFGTPRIVAALEDVKLLRKIEGIVINLVYRFAIPIYHWKIGIPEAGFQATDPEISDAQNEIENMSMDGVIVTNERTNIDAIGADGTALDALGYLKYFEKRAFTALNVSESLMGRGGSKQGADSMEAQMHDTIKFIQKTMSIFIENLIIGELLLEGGYDPIFNEDHIVNYVFNEISLDTKVKLENHEMLKFQSNVVTHEELRRNIGLEEECDEDRLYNNMIVKKSALEQIEAKQKTSKPGGNGKEVQGSPNKDVSTRSNPENQHGVYTAKIKEGLSLSESKKNKSKNDTKSENKKKYQSIYSIYEAIMNDLIEASSKSASIDLIMAAGGTSLTAEFISSLNVSSQYGLSHGLEDVGKHRNVSTIPSVDLTEIESNLKRDLSRLIDDINKKLEKDSTAKNIRAVFGSFEYRIRYIIEHHFRKAYWHAFLTAGKSNGVKTANIDFDNSKDAENHNSKLNLNKYTLADIPAFHPFCDCTISFTK